MLSRVLKKLRSTGWFWVVFLSACAGSSPAEMGGPGGPGGPVGGPLDGSGQFAAGPVSLPAPTSVAREPTLNFYALKISCKNLPGPSVECKGDPFSVPPSSSLRISVHPPGNLGTVTIGSQVDFSANSDGTWNQSVTATAGQMIRICLLKSGTCYESLFMTVPPEGGEIKGTQGILKNLVIDSQGKVFFSMRATPRAPKRGWSWTSLFVSEAHADEPAGGAGGLNLWSTFSGEAVQLLLNLYYPEPPDPKWIAADCPAQPAFIEFTAVGDETHTRMAGNFAMIRRFLPNPETPEDFYEPIMKIPDATREDIHDLAAFTIIAGGGSTIFYLAAAVKNHVYLINYTSQPYIEYRFDFPQEFLVNQLIESSASLFVTLMAKDGGPKPAYPLYRISQIYDYVAGSYQRDLKAQCTPPSNAIGDLKEIVQIDAVNNKFAAVGVTDGGNYRILVGSPMIWSDLTDFPPVMLLEFSHSVEAKVLALDAVGIRLVVLDPTEKTLRLIAYRWATAPESAEVQVLSLSDLLPASQFSYPRLLTVDREGGTFAFLDILETGSKLLSFQYTDDDADPQLGDAEEYRIGVEVPSILRRQDNAWVYNDSQGQMRIAGN